MTRIAIVGLLFVALGGGGAWAGGVKGTIALPAEPKFQAAPGLWRVENGILPLAVRKDFHDVVVVLEPDELPGKKPEPATVTVELRGLRLDPKVIAIPEGTELVFKNLDRFNHVLYLENAPKLLAVEPLAPKQTRSKKFVTAGEFRILDEEFPHLSGSVLVLATPFFTNVDEKGAFRIEAPEGRYLLKVYWRDGWVYSRPVEVGLHTTELAVHVPARPAEPKGETTP